MKKQKVNRKVSSADKNKSGRFTVTFNVTVTSEVFKALNVSSDMTVSELKNIAELTAGVPTSIQRIHYIDEGRLIGPIRQRVRLRSILENTFAFLKIVG